MSTLTLIGSGALFGTSGVGFGVAASYPAYVVAGETVPPGFLGPVAPRRQECYEIAENGAATPGSWPQAGTSATPSGSLVYNLTAGSMLTTLGYAGGRLQVWAPGDPSATGLGLRITRESTGQVLYDAVASEVLPGTFSQLLHDVALPEFAAWRVVLTNTGAANVDRIEWI